MLKLKKPTESVYLVNSPEIPCLQTSKGLSVGSLNSKVSAEPKVKLLFRTAWKSLLGNLWD